VADPFGHIAVQQHKLSMRWTCGYAIAVDFYTGNTPQNAVTSGECHQDMSVMHLDMSAQLVQGIFWWQTTLRQIQP
jgi:hypothetical protein